MVLTQHKRFGRRHKNIGSHIRVPPRYNQITGIEQYKQLGLLKVPFCHAMYGNVESISLGSSLDAMLSLRMVSSCLLKSYGGLTEDNLSISSQLVNHFAEVQVAHRLLASWES
jgi:hypothetical protein